MVDSNETFILLTTLTSPFGRKVRIAAEALGISERIKVVNASGSDEELLKHNPLGKIPCLVRCGQSAIFDSSVIIEFLQCVVGTDSMLPKYGSERVRMLTLARLADGIIDAGALIIYEDRFHADNSRSETWVNHQCEKIVRALNTFEAAPPHANNSNAVTISLACALAFLDKRKLVEWRSKMPRLVDWLNEFSINEPAFNLTAPPV